MINLLAKSHLLIIFWLTDNFMTFTTEKKKFGNHWVRQYHWYINGNLSKYFPKQILKIYLQNQSKTYLTFSSRNWRCCLQLYINNLNLKSALHCNAVLLLSKSQKIKVRDLTLIWKMLLHWADGNPINPLCPLQCDTSV